MGEGADRSGRDEPRGERSRRDSATASPERRGDRWVPLRDVTY